MANKNVETLEEELEALKQEFEDFAYIVSHDLSGPLRHAAGFAEMVLSNNPDTLNEKSMRHLGFIIESAEKGRMSLEHLRQYSRLNTREYDLSERVDMNEIVQNVIKALKVDIETASATINVSDLPSVKGSSTLITRAFKHLLHNAILYRAEGQAPFIHLSCEPITLPNGVNFWQFVFKDDGIGIREGGMEDIFKIFKRGVEQYEYPGDGMGLSLARKIAQKHGGFMKAESDFGKGSTFYFTLPQ